MFSKECFIIWKLKRNPTVIEVACFHLSIGLANLNNITVYFDDDNLKHNELTFYNRFA